MDRQAKEDRRSGKLNRAFSSGELKVIIFRSRLLVYSVPIKCKLHIIILSIVSQMEISIEFEKYFFTQNLSEDTCILLIKSSNCIFQKCQEKRKVLYCNVLVLHC